jgi:hypothetical protein
MRVWVIRSLLLIPTHLDARLAGTDAGFYFAPAPAGRQLVPIRFDRAIVVIYRRVMIALALI